MNLYNETAYRIARARYEALSDAYMAAVVAAGGQHGNPSLCHAVLALATLCGDAKDALFALESAQVA